MKAILAASAASAALAILFVGGCGARADDGNASFRVHNNLHETVGVWVASEKNPAPNPWTHIEIEPDKDATFTLQYPDRFVVAVDVGKQHSRSKPVALKAFLAAHPDHELRFDIHELSGAAPDALETPEQPTDYGFDFVPTKPYGEHGARVGVVLPNERLSFDFRPEPSPNARAK